MTSKPSLSFYSVGAYEPDKSIGFLMRLLLKSFKHARDTRLAGHGYEEEHWVPIFKLQREGKCTLDGLVAELGLDRSAMNKTLTFLQEREIVLKTELKKEIAYELSAKGQELGGMVQQVLVNIANEHLQGFTDSEFITLVSLLQKMCSNVHPTSAA